MAKTIAYYISAHGYGHGVRSSDVIRSLVNIDPSIRIIIVTDLPEAFLRNRIPHGNLVFHRGRYDVGMVQLDSIKVDVGATLREVQQLYAHRRALTDQVKALLCKEKADCVVADIPPIPIEAASELGVPSLAIGNFAWNWIYEPFMEQHPGWKELVHWFEEAYSKTGLLLKLPFSEPMKVFPRRENMNLLASPGQNRRMEMAEALGADPAMRWVLLSFTTLDWDAETASRVGHIPGCRFFTVQPLAWPGSGILGIDREQFSFSDVLASVDGVVSKPGYGLLSDCVVNRKPLLYADREHFIEYPVLVDAINRYLSNAHIPVQELYQGNLEPFLDKLWCASEAKEPMPGGGAEAAARRILEAG